MLHIISKFPLAQIGALATGSVHARPSAQAPINTSGNFWQVSGGNKIEKISDQFSKRFSFFPEKK
jgi:hypothetical protein